MPTYQYLCTKCGHEFEVFQSITEKPLTTCPKDQCARKRWGKGRVKRQIGAGAGLLFKGSGFYITDYRSESYKQAAKKESASASGSGSDGKPTQSAGSSGNGSSGKSSESKSSTGKGSSGSAS